MPKNKATKNVLEFIKEESQQAEAVAFMAIWQSIEHNEPVEIMACQNSLDANLAGRLSNVAEKIQRIQKMNYYEEQFTGTLNNKRWKISLIRFN